MFVEAQFQPDPDFHARWFSELFLDLYRRPPRRSWRAVALFPNRAAEGTVEVETLLVYKLPRLSREEIRKMLNLLNVELKETRFYQEVFAEGVEEGQREERLRIARRLLDVILDDRLLVEKTGLSEADVRELREQGR